MSSTHDQLISALIVCIQPEKTQSLSIQKCAAIKDGLHKIEEVYNLQEYHVDLVLDLLEAVGFDLNAPNC
jgi:hypothetical protein